MLLNITAVHLHRVLSSGRNKPALFGCVDEKGNLAGDFVAKMCGFMDTRAGGPASELIASLLAQHFGILHPDPAAVTIHPDLVTWLAKKRPDLADGVRESAGLNFGTRLLLGASEWPIGRALPDAMIIPASHIFAFDALISNDDRRYQNQNILVRSDDIFMFQCNRNAS